MRSAVSAVASRGAFFSFEAISCEISDRVKPSRLPLQDQLEADAIRRLVEPRRPLAPGMQEPLVLVEAQRAQADVVEARQVADRILVTGGRAVHFNSGKLALHFWLHRSNASRPNAHIVTTYKSGRD